jgi:F-type H+-transporting ATPase subunit epsilon
LADSAEHADEIDMDRAERARIDAEEAMKAGVPADAERYAQIDAALRRARIRINVSRRRSGARRRRAMMSELGGEDEE